ncbi:lamin tail domain-containing protein [Halocatena salina]|uniref:Lamin tail domain-containing protein n=1 Tax=Halocatena salina TaxID=2934340 RepID=A0A8U0AC04_9EURY|nr:lamin tail domain-containing protein [Halocatena salina]UPM45287.1 lamin tail domain-containing protein [Halocatena salina]
MQRKTLLALTLVFILVLAGCTNGPVDGTPTPEQPSIPDGLSIHYINTGLGTSTLIKEANETILIDSGDWQDDGDHVLDYLRANGIARIDHLVSTHPDSDHIGGQAAVIEYFEEEADGIGAVYDPGVPATTRTYDRYLDAIETYDVQLYQTRAGDELPFAGADVRVLSPPEPYLANEEPNENSIVLQVEHGQAGFLFPGDAAEAGEEYLVNEYGNSMNVSALLAGHHGSNSSSSAALLDATTPAVTVISSPYDSQYGHPHEEVLARLAARAIPTYWTGTHGDIVMHSNGSALTIATQREAPTESARLRKGEPIEPEANEPVKPRTVIALSTGKANSPAGPDSGPETDTGHETLSITEINADAAGDDRENLNDEYVTFEHMGDQPLDLSGWTVADDAGATYTFPDGTMLDPGDELTLHTGRGSDSATDLYWGSTQPVWNNAGDTVIVRDTTGTTVLEEDYS